MIYAENDHRIVNASVQFDESTLKPTYKLKQGEMGQSNAIDLAIKKGFPDKVVRNAKGFLNSQEEDLKIYIKDLINLKQLYEKRISKISEEKNEINLIKNEINEQIKYLISNKNQMINSILYELLGRKKRAIKKLELELKDLKERFLNLEKQIKKKGE